MNEMMHIIDAIKSEQRKGKKIVFTNGCFDILHRGHVTYLNQARDLGDLLIVGINSDESVKRLKGPERPVNMLEDRAYVLSALKSVDYVIPFEEDTPLNLINLIMPDITMCKGDGCVFKDTCYRHIATPSEYRQSYFLSPPIKKDSCDYYWEQCPVCKMYDGKHRNDCTSDNIRTTN